MFQCQLYSAQVQRDRRWLIHTTLPLKISANNIVCCFFFFLDTCSRRRLAFCLSSAAST
jgi:hypothetical protein